MRSYPKRPAPGCAQPFSFPNFPWFTSVSVSEMDSSEYIQSLPPDVRKRYQTKTAAIGCDPYSIVVGDFSKDVTKWPQVGFLDIINYLIDSPSAYTSEQLKKYKSLDAYKFYQDGWIRQILHKKIEGIHLIRAKVKLIKFVIIVERCLAKQRGHLFICNATHCTVVWVGPVIFFLN